MPAQKTFQVRGEHLTRLGPSRAHEIEFIGADLGEIQAGANREMRKSRVMLDAADALLGHGIQQLAIAGDAGRRVMHLRIIKSQSKH